MLEQVGDPEATAALADKLLAEGLDTGAKIIQKAINKAGGNVAVDGAPGSKTIDAYKQLIGTRAGKRRVLDALADEQWKIAMTRPDKDGWKTRIDHFRFQSLPGNSP